LAQPQGMVKSGGEQLQLGVPVLAVVQAQGFSQLVSVQPVRVKAVMVKASNSTINIAISFVVLDFKCIIVFFLKLSLFFVNLVNYIIYVA